MVPQLHAPCTVLVVPAPADCVSGVLIAGDGYVEGK
jgi:hypothetical protein